MDFIGDGRCVTHHEACECRERHFKGLEIRLSAYEKDVGELLDKYVLDKEDKIDREDLKAMVNGLIGKCERLRKEYIAYREGQR